MIISKRELQQWRGIPIYKVKENLQRVDEYGYTWLYSKLSYQFVVFGKHYECETLKEAHKTITSIL